MQSSRPYASARKSNAAAICVAGLSFLVLYTSFDPVPAGEEIRSGTDAALTAVDFSIRDEVPLPPEAAILKDAVPVPADPSATAKVETTVTETSATDAAAPVVAVPVAPVTGVVLSDQEAVQYCLFLLENGARYLESIPNYAVTFGKQERINGDLSESQIIDMKIQHTPKFSVYMKWKNGDAGRQVLFSEQYDDGQMVVKLGGIKGRLLPALKLDPRGDRAMSESRYPVTEAGILGMLKQITTHRKNDLSRGHGVHCRRLPNQTFDERNCICIEFEYTGKEHSEIYRKSIILIDARHHIPVMARNYTWAREPEGLTPAQLDEQTLIENYTFTSINFGAELIAEEFRRDNPKYRM